MIATADETREPDRLRSLIERAAATAMQATPQTWRLLESAGGVPAGLRLRLCGGESLPADLADKLMAPGATLWNLYGPTETTVWSAAGVVTSAAGAAEIGPPIDHTRVYVLDERLRPVPVGVVGEVCLAGQGVARGYHDQPRLTARSFRPDPWSDVPGARLYRTGDLGRWREGAGLELIGRNDHQVKIRGFRIECGEIEAVLRAHRDVRQAAVVSAPRAGEPALVAYIVPRRGSTLAQPGTDLLEELRPHLRAALPDYMIPALVVALPTLPLTPNAKVNRAALPAPQWGAQPTAAGRVEPRNPVEATLAQIWGDLLDTEAPVGVTDNLFALGGHSLTATRLSPVSLTPTVSACRFTMSSPAPRSRNWPRWSPPTRISGLPRTLPATPSWTRSATMTWTSYCVRRLPSATGAGRTRAAPTVERRAALSTRRPRRRFRPGRGRRRSASTRRGIRRARRVPRS